MAATRSTAACFRQSANTIRSRPRNGVQDAAFRYLSESTLAIDAARSQSRHLPSRAGNNHVAATGSATGPDRLDAFLSRARSGHRRVMQRLLCGRLETPELVQ